MSSKQRGLRFWLSAWLPVVLGILVIAVESTLYFGAEYTSGPFRWVFQAIFGPVSDARWGIIHLLIRKSGHFLGYGLIGLAWLRAWWMTLPHSRFLSVSALALLGTAIVSASDEFHQFFLPDRTGTPWDVLLDCCGAIVMQMLVYMLVRLFWPKRLERAA
ncbi:MAG: VanZ family protein [Acidobacteriota bacterium]|nr:VanZ family protein [Acidobacteriota bacterium]